jgi:hypothetical protein
MTTSTGEHAAANERATRTLWQGLGIDVLIAIAAALLTWLPSADVLDGAAWLLLGTVLVKTVLQAAAAYVMRLKLEPSREVAARTTAARVEGIYQHDDAGRVDGNLVAAIVIAGLLVWLLVKVLELVIG